MVSGHDSVGAPDMLLTCIYLLWPTTLPSAVPVIRIQGSGSESLQQAALPPTSNFYKSG